MVGQALADLSYYTETHFADEEVLMLAGNFPGYKQHKLLHDDMALRTAELVEQFRVSRGDFSVEVLSFLKKWWQNHNPEGYNCLLNKR